MGDEVLPSALGSAGNRGEPVWPPEELERFAALEQEMSSLKAEMPATRSLHHRLPALIRRTSFGHLTVHDFEQFRFNFC
jgi:hypothetical protein